MPGIDCRFDSSRTKLFHAATIGRGSQVVRIVSSMSLTRPNSAASSTISTGHSAGRDWAVCAVTVCQPGSNECRVTRWSR
ncbi:MAG: hypothetical protein R2742_09905 [Micropruina glycogenica]